MLYTLKTPEMFSVMSADGLNVALFTDYEKWQERTASAPCALYHLPPDSFSNTVSTYDGQPTQEWTSRSTVTPIATEQVTPQGVMQTGAQLFFLDSAIDRPVWDGFLAKITPKLEPFHKDGFHGHHLLRELQDAGLVAHHLNQEQGVESATLPKHHAAGQAIREDIADLKQQAAAKQVAAIRDKLSNIVQPPGIIYPTPEAARKDAPPRTAGEGHAR